MNKSDVKELYEYLKELLKASRFLVNRKELKHDIDNIKKRVYENLKLQRKDIQTLRNIITKNGVVFNLIY